MTDSDAIDQFEHDQSSHVQCSAVMHNPTAKRRKDRQTDQRADATTFSAHMQTTQFTKRANALTTQFSKRFFSDQNPA